MRACLLGLLLFPGFLYPSTAAEVLQQDPRLRLVGEGELAWLGMTVYQARLYGLDGSYRPDQPHAIRIDYRFGFSREELARSSLKEIERVGGREPDPDLLLARFRTLFRDVAPGDRLTGVHYPGEGAQFYQGDTYIGSIDDAHIAMRFFSIWLDPKSRRPKLREQLLGGYP